ncbi:MAG: hypothetical protein ACQERB_15335 [Promethearchaeati archaeon]
MNLPKPIKAGIFVIFLFLVFSISSSKVEKYPVRVSVIKNDFSHMTLKAVGFFHKYRTENVLLSGEQNCFHIKTDDAVHRLALRYMVQAKFEVTGFGEAQSLYCEWLAKFPWDRKHRKFKGYYPRLLKNVYEVSLIYLDGGKKEYLDLREVYDLRRQER